MQRLVCLTAALVLMTSGTAFADDKADVKAVIAKAIKAAGGEEKLAKFTGETFKGKGKYYGMGEGIDYTGEWAVQLPDKARVKIDTTAGNMKFTFVRVVNGDKVWRKLGEEKAQLLDNKEEIAEAREELHAEWVATLIPLKNKGFQLAPLGEIKVDGKPAVGVRVSNKGRRDVNLYFDKDKGLLVKSETLIKDHDAGGKEMTQEVLYSNYKEVNGVKRPMQVVINRDGKKYIESEMTEVEPKEKIDDAVFGQP
jgi:hypothetical protein